VFVEAKTVGRRDWTTLRDLNGHTNTGTGASCPTWHELHPFLAHYQSVKANGRCAPRGTTGKWRAASGASDGWEHWAVSLSRYAGRDVKVSITYASDTAVQLHGVFVDDIVVSTGSGSTSFEDDGDTLDGWRVPGAPRGSKPNPNDWIVGTAREAPSLGKTAQQSFSRQGEIIAFLSQFFGPYPFSAAGGIVDDMEGLGFALENQTRPIYSKDFFLDQVSGDAVVVHELAHQWYGNSLTLAAWRHIWLNEGFATYAEWLWSKREGFATPREIFKLFFSIPRKNPFWRVKIGNPGPKFLFDFAVYARGAMTLHQLRRAVGDEIFFEILRRWATSQSGGNVTTGEFIDLAQRVSGRNLRWLFKRWLFTRHKPKLVGTGSGVATLTDVRRTRAAARSVQQRLDRQVGFRSKI
jgi:hypothetical protein